MVQTVLGFLVKDLFEGDDRHMQNAVEQYCNAQLHVLQLAFDTFLRLVYRKGMSQLAVECSVGWTHCQFGSTELRVACGIAQVQLIFVRGTKQNSEEELCFSFLMEEADALGLSAGVQFVCADLRTCLDMIDDVINHWPGDPDKQAKLFG